MLDSFLLGMIPALNVLWDLSLLRFAATAGTWPLLIHIHRRAVGTRGQGHRHQEASEARESMRREHSHPRPPNNPERSTGPMTNRSPEFGLDYDEIVAGGR